VPTVLHVSETQTMRMLLVSDVIALLDDARRWMFASSHTGDIQRSLDPEHLDALLEYQAEHKQRTGAYAFHTPIAFAKLRDDDKYALLDGQHRVEAARRLLHDDPIGMAGQHVLVSVFTIRDASEYDDLFVAINKNKPVQLYSNLRDWKGVIRHLETYFRTHYAAYLKPSGQPRRPHFNLEALLLHIDESGILRELDLGYEELVNEIEALNTYYDHHWKSALQNTRYVPNAHLHIDACRRKAPHRPCYLGVFTQFEWLDRIRQKVRQPGIAYADIKHVPKTFGRKRVTGPLRERVWAKRNARNLDGACFVCEKPVTFSAFESGHVISVYHGGPTTLDNLEPICKVCNRDMGVQNLDAYKQEMLAH
jgi:5-methylcytosine-specific restriction endonuclease McrA